MLGNFFQFLNKLKKSKNVKDITLNLKRLFDKLMVHSCSWAKWSGLKENKRFDTYQFTYEVGGLSSSKIEFHCCPWSLLFRSTLLNRTDS